MESFFGHLKTALLDLVALCPDLETAMRLVNGYISSYNNDFYQYNLAGLTPAEFYTYVTTGIYPLDNYYGVKAEELRSVTDLVNDRRKKAEEKNTKDRAAYARKSEERNKLKKSPFQILARDQKIIRQQIKKWKDSRSVVEEQLTFLNTLMEKTKKASQFLVGLPKEIYDTLYTPQNWQKYPELEYIFDMKGLF